MPLYRRLLHFLRPYRGRVAGTLLLSATANALAALSFALFIPFLNTLFALPPLGVGTPNRMSALLRRSSVPLSRKGASKMDALRTVILVILATMLLKNAFAWLAGQMGAGLQERVTRDLRNAVYTHLELLSLRFFQRHKTRLPEMETVGG